MLSREQIKKTVIEVLNEWDKTHEDLFYEDVPDVADLIADKILKL